VGGGGGCPAPPTDSIVANVGQEETEEEEGPRAQLCTSAEPQLYDIVKVGKWIKSKFVFSLQAEYEHRDEGNDGGNIKDNVPFLGIPRAHNQFCHCRIYLNLIWFYFRATTV
jgi:hypothetical protein